MEESPLNTQNLACNTDNVPVYRICLSVSSTLLNHQDRSLEKACPSFDLKVKKSSVIG